MYVSINTTFSLAYLLCPAATLTEAQPFTRAQPDPTATHSSRVLTATAHSLRRPDSRFRRQLTSHGQVTSVSPLLLSESVALSSLDTFGDFEIPVRL